MASLVERRLADFYERFYLENGRTPPTAILMKATRSSSDDVVAFLKSAFFRTRMKNTGVPLPDQEDLSIEQVATAIVMTNFADHRNMDMKLAELGITKTQYYGWQKNPRYKQFLRRLSDDYLETLNVDAKAAFARAIRAGKLPALKLYFEMTGEAQSPELQNLKLVVQQLVDSVQRHVDPAQLKAIVGDLTFYQPALATTVIPAVPDGMNEGSYGEEGSEMKSGSSSLPVGSFDPSESEAS